MVYAAPRSMNHDLEQGMADGKYKQITPNRGGVVEKELAYAVRQDLSDVYFGVHEIEAKRLPDGTLDPSSPNFVASKSPTAADTAPNKLAHLPGD